MQLLKHIHYVPITDQEKQPMVGRYVLSLSISELASLNEPVKKNKHPQIPKEAFARNIVNMKEREKDSDSRKLSKKKMKK